MLRVFVVAMAVAVANAAVIGTGQCPDTTPVQNFDVSAYGGLWYEIAKFPTIDQRGGTCSKAQYTLGQNGIVHVKNSNVVNGVLESIEGTARLADDANNSAKLLVTLNFGPQSHEQNLQVLATDYSNYAIAYNCRFDDSTNQSSTFLWVLSRTNTLTGAAKDAVDAWFAANPAIDQSQLVYTDQSEAACQYTSTGTVDQRPTED